MVILLTIIVIIIIMYMMITLINYEVLTYDRLYYN